MDSVVLYNLIQKDMFSSKQEYLDVLAYWDGAIHNGTFLNLQIAVDVETSLHRDNVKKIYVQTAPIFKLLYL